MKEITLKAMAKINLGLDVIRRREDGYHEVRMIMQTVNLYDELTSGRNTASKKDCPFILRKKYLLLQEWREEAPMPPPRSPV